MPQPPPPALLCSMTGLRWVAPGLLVGPHNAWKKTTNPWCVLYVGTAEKDAPPGHEIVRVHAPFDDCTPAPASLLPLALSLYGQTGADRPLWICCDAGISRSAALAYGCVRFAFGLSHEAALRQVALCTLVDRDPGDYTEHYLAPRTQPLLGIREQLARMRGQVLKS